MTEHLEAWVIPDRTTDSVFAIAVASADGKLGYGCTVSRKLAGEKRPWDPASWALEEARKMAAGAFAAAAKMPTPRGAGPGPEGSHECSTCGAWCVCAEWYDGDPCEHCG